MPVSVEERREKARKHYQENKGAFASKQKEYRRVNRERLLAKKREYYHKNKEAIAIKKKPYLERNRDRLSADVRAYTRRLKIEIINAYGGSCVCCGESDVDFLTIDHVIPLRGKDRYGNKDGNSGSPLYRRLRKEGYPGGYQSLCYNCNCAKRCKIECPHQSKRLRSFIQSTVLMTTYRK